MTCEQNILVITAVNKICDAENIAQMQGWLCSKDILTSLKLHICLKHADSGNDEENGLDFTVILDYLLFVL